MTRRCAWCGRETTAYLAHDLAADHGPVAVVWCADWRDCWSARSAGAIHLSRARAYPPDPCAVREPSRPGPRRPPPTRT
jgi:hypothetical protein